MVFILSCGKRIKKQALVHDGRLMALLEMRDTDLQEHINNINLLSVNLADIVNEVHRDGFGLTKENQY